MNFKYSQDQSSSIVSDFSSNQKISSASSRTLGQTGARIMNNSYPLASKKSEVKKENETYAYLEKLKFLKNEESRIEHIHHIRYLDYLDYSFKKQGKDIDLYASSNVVIPEYKESTVDTLLSNNEAKVKLEQKSKALIRLVTRSNQFLAVALPFGFIITEGLVDKLKLKKSEIYDSEGKPLSKNKFGPFISSPDFSLFTVTNPGPNYLNPYVSFKLSKLDSVHLISNPDDSWKVVDITHNYFVFSTTSIRSFKKSEPVFSVHFELQGFYSHCVLNLHFVNRLEPIFAYLLRTQPETMSDELDSLLSFYSKFRT